MRPAILQLATALLALALFASLPAGAQAQEGYLGSAVCGTCHAEQAENWTRSHHALAWTLPSPETILADFADSRFQHDGMEARFRVDAEGNHSVTVTEKDGRKTDYPIHSVVGVEPLQQYLLETEPGRLQSFDVVWDSEKGGWFHLYPDQDLPPDDGLHWTGAYKNWNGRCAVCHATGFRKNYDPTGRGYASTQAEMGVGCEACHGPGAKHLAWLEERAAPHDHPTHDHPTDDLPAGTYGFSLDLSDREAVMGQCAGCHSRREALLGGTPPPGTPYHDGYSLALLRPGLYHADGQILDEVYVLGSFLQSKMYARGVGCLDCHEPHGARLVAEGNAVCTQCHSPAGNTRFPTLAKADYDSSAHHFHDPASAGGQCVSCHMIERTYMGNDGRRDHSFRIPRPDLAATTGAPDACTDCHDERTSAWAAARLEEWYPDSEKRGPHYGVALAQGRRDPRAASGELADLALDRERPGIVRATALWLLEQSDRPDLAERLAPLLEDEDPVVRAAAVGVQRLAPPPERVPRLLGLLTDPVRSVRISAARAMLDAPVAYMPERIAADLRLAMGEWQNSLAQRLDFPETHLQIGGMALTLRNLPSAQAAFREVVRMDPQRTEAWVMLARIAAVTGGEEAAGRVLAEALAINPEDGTLQGLARELPGTSGTQPD